MQLQPAPARRRFYYEPQAATAIKDDLAVEIDREMKRRGIRLSDLARFGLCESRIKQISRYLRGEDASVGPIGALTLAEKLGIPVRVLVGEEAREVA